MAKPRKSTRDEAVDQFADWPSDVQESMLDQFQMLHRQTLRREAREKAATAAKAGDDSKPPAPLFDVTDHTTKPEAQQ